MSFDALLEDCCDGSHVVAWALEKMGQSHASNGILIATFGLRIFRRMLQPGRHYVYVPQRRRVAGSAMLPTIHLQV